MGHMPQEGDKDEAIKIQFEIDVKEMIMEALSETITQDEKKKLLDIVEAEAKNLAKYESVKI